jgi:putative MFS transporter
MAELWTGRYARRTAMLWILWFGVVLTYYAMFLWIPSLLVARGFDAARPGQANMLFFLSTLAQVPGYFSAAWLVERWGRKPTLVVFLLGTAVSAFMFGNIGAGTDVAHANLVLLWLSLLSFFNLGAWGVVYTYTPELYPTSIRATGAGVAAAVGRVGGIVGPYLTPLLVTAVATNGTFAVFMVLLVITAAAVAVLGEETRGRSLEEIAPEAEAA